MCQKERTIRYDLKNPFKNKWFKLRYRAKCRGKKFKISYEEFKQFCLDNQLEGKTGRTAECLSIDCRDPRLGYVSSNLRVVTVSENSKKSDLLPEELPDWYLERNKDECPF